MKAISLHQPWASLCVTRQPCDICAGPAGPPIAQPYCDGCPMVKRFIDSPKPCPPELIGQPIAIHATQTPPRGGETRQTGDYWWYVGNGGAWMSRSLLDSSHTIRLPLGAVVGSGRITASLPIVHWSDDDEEQPPCITVGHSDGRIYAKTVGVWGALDISDQLPYGDFTPGRYAWLIEDAAPTTERCPYCWGKQWIVGEIGIRGEQRFPCPACKGAGRCDPIPARGRQRLWNWQPS